MTLDTIPTDVSSDTVRKYLRRLDERGESYGFNVVSSQQNKNLILELYRDGCDDALSVCLAADGTWTASHVIVVGEKE